MNPNIHIKRTKIFNILKVTKIKTFNIHDSECQIQRNTQKISNLEYILIKLYVLQWLVYVKIKEVYLIFLKPLKNKEFIVF